MGEFEPNPLQPEAQKTPTLEEVDLNLPDEEYQALRKKAYEAHELPDEECTISIQPGEVLRRVDGTLLKVNSPIDLKVRKRDPRDYENMRKAEFNDDLFWIQGGFGLPDEQDAFKNK